MFHPFYVRHSDKESGGSVYDGEWKAASNLLAGDVLQKIDGSTVYVTEVTVEKLPEIINVYNLEIEDLHTYYVADGVLVHNQYETNGSQSDSESGNDTGYKVSDSRKSHILEGEGPTDPGHGPNRGFTEGVFPDTWNDEQVILAIENVANSPNSTWKQSTGPGASTAPITVGMPDINAPATTNKGTPIRFMVKGCNHGLNITVIIEPNGEGIITGYNNGR